MVIVMRVETGTVASWKSTRGAHWSPQMSGPRFSGHFRVPGNEWPYPLVPDQRAGICHPIEKLLYKKLILALHSLAQMAHEGGFILGEKAYTRG
jgi:hypothetical protein